MNVNKILPFVLLLPFLASCTHKYKIEGTSSVNGLDGKMLYLKTLRDGEWTKLDSAEVVHGSFSMKGKIDSVQMTTLYMDDESVMPVVLESGKIVITISNTDLKAVGTPLNTALYDFIAKKNAMEESIGELERKETRMVMDGADLEEVHEQLLAEGDSLMKAMNQYVKTFISDNYENEWRKGDPSPRVGAWFTNSKDFKTISEIYDTGSSRPIIPRDSVGDRWCDIRAVCRGERFGQRESDLTLL